MSESNFPLDAFTEQSDNSNPDHPRSPEHSESIIETLAARPDPTEDSEALQTAHEAGRAVFAPYLRACSVPHDPVQLPRNLYHQQANTIVDALESLQNITGHRMYRVFDDFIEIAFQTLRAHPDQTTYQESIEPYAFTDDGTRRSGEPSEAFKSAFVTLVDGTAEGRLDILGDVYHLLEANHDDFGQYFTPHNITHAMVRIAGIADKADSSYGRGDTDPEEIDARSIVGDTAGCGSGRLIAYKAAAAPDAFFVGVDIDRTCAKMTAINLALLNVDGHVIHGDALTVEVHNEFSIHHDPDRGGLIAQHDDANPSTDPE